MLKLIANWWRDNAMIIAIAISLLILITSLINPISVPINTVKISDKTFHFFGYFVLMNGWMMVLYQKNNMKHKYFLLFFLSIFGIIIEILQGGMHNQRTQDLFDAIANIIGLLIGMLFFGYLIFQKKRFF